MTKYSCQIFLFCTCLLFIEISAMGRYVPPLYMRQKMPETTTMKNMFSLKNTKIPTFPVFRVRRTSLAELRNMVKTLSDW
jgi:hypothetical protein